MVNKNFEPRTQTTLESNLKNDSKPRRAILDIMLLLMSLAGQSIFLFFTTFFFTCGMEGTGCRLIEGFKNPLVLIFMVMFIMLDGIYIYGLLKSILEKMFVVRVIIYLFIPLFIIFASYFAFVKILVILTP